MTHRSLDHDSSKDSRSSSAIAACVSTSSVLKLSTPWQQQKPNMLTCICIKIAPKENTVAPKENTVEISPPCFFGMHIYIYIHTNLIIQNFPKLKTKKMGLAQLALNLISEGFLIAWSSRLRRADDLRKGRLQGGTAYQEAVHIRQLAQGLELDCWLSWSCKVCFVDTLRYE